MGAGRNLLHQRRETEYEGKRVQSKKEGHTVPPVGQRQFVNKSLGNLVGVFLGGIPTVSAELTQEKEREGILYDGDAEWGGQIGNEQCKERSYTGAERDPQHSK